MATCEFGSDFPLPFGNLSLRRVFVIPKPLASQSADFLRTCLDVPSAGAGGITLTSWSRICWRLLPVDTTEWPLEQAESLCSVVARPWPSGAAHAGDFREAECAARERS